MDSIKKHRSRNRVVDDLLLEILSRVPAKSLIRFKCVSKSWCGLLSDLCYQKSLASSMHGLFYEVSSSSVLRGTGLKIRYISILNDSMISPTLSFLPFFDNLRIIDCCNGLLLCFSQTGMKVFYVCNPATKKYVALPSTHKSGLCLILAYDPRLSPHYKVIHFFRDKSRVERMEIFSSETGGWIEIEMSWGPEVKFFWRRQRIFLNGSLHVLAFPSHTIVGINLRDNSCQSFALPEPASTSSNGCVGQSGGYLHFVHKDDDELRIWMLKDHGSNGWILKHRINVQTVVKQVQHFLTSFGSTTLVILAFHPELDVVFLRLRGSLYSYHFASSKLEEVCGLGIMNRPWCFPYSPSLIEWAF